MDDLSQALNDVLTGFAERDRFVIASHPRMDPDAIGSCLALMLSLEDQGKQACVVSQGKFSREYLDLPGADRVLTLSQDPTQPLPELPFTPATVVILDIGSPTRAELVTGHFPGLPIINLDHHISNDGFGDVSLVDDTFAATGELLYEIMDRGHWPISPAVADNLYAAILTDTGCFTYSNTTPRSLYVAGKIVERGAQPSIISRMLYRNKSLAYIRLEGLVVNRLRTAAGGRLAWSHITREDVSSLGLSLEETGNLVNLVKALGSAQMAMLFVEVAEGKTKLSFRGEGHHNLNEVAAIYGGGGHPRASGATVDLDVDAAMDKVIEDLIPLCEDPDLAPRF